MRPDAARDMKTRIRTDLRTAMKEGRPDEAKVLRVLIAALDNAEAPPTPPQNNSAEPHQFVEGSAEVIRLSLSPTQIRKVLQAEIGERETAADEMQRLAQQDRADALHAEVQLIKRYID